jgi:hypothetical protein
VKANFAFSRLRLEIRRCVIDCKRLGKRKIAKVYAEKQSGAKTDRAQLAKAIAALGPADTLVVCKLDRPARSTRDLLNTLDAIGKAGATFKSLGDGWADTNNRTVTNSALALTWRRVTARLLDRSLVIPPATRGFCSIFLRFILDLSFTARSGFLDHLNSDGFDC